MEVNENERKDYYYYSLEYKGQDVSTNPDFQKWYKKVQDYIKKENKIRGLIQIDNNKYWKYEEERFFILSLCPNCNSYSICVIKFYYCFITCKKCKERFCIGCSKKGKDSKDDTICIKGYFRLLYHRIIFKRSDYAVITTYSTFIHILICLFITLIYLGFASGFMGFNTHNNRENLYEKMLREERFCNYVMIFSLLKGLLMFPFIMNFFPFMVLLLLPSIFSRNYYPYIFNMYITILMPGDRIYV